MSTQAYDKDGNKIPFALIEGDYLVHDLRTVEQLHATVAEQAAQYSALCTQVESLTVENERLREVMRRLEEDARELDEAWSEHGCLGKDAIRFVAGVSDTLSATLQPKEGNQ